MCTTLANIATPAVIGRTCRNTPVDHSDRARAEQLESLATTAALAQPRSFLQNCSNSFDCHLGFRCVCNGTQNVCLRVNHTVRSFVGLR